MSAPPFIHLHLHTDYSMLDGLGKPVRYVDEAEERGDPALAITDHGNMSGVYEFYMACIKAGIRPIPGCEFYFHPNANKAKLEKDRERFHVVMLAKNEAGYRTLVALQDEAHSRFYGKPLLDRHVCEQLGYEEAENLVVLSGCAASILSKKVMGEEPGSVTQELLWWRETFPHFYIELQHHGTDFDRTLNTRLLKLAQKYKLPWVITNDPHYVTEDQCDYHDALLAVQTNAQIDDPNRFAFSGSGYHLRTRAEMVKAFQRYGEGVWKPGVRETAKIAMSCDVRIPEWDNKSWHIPRYRRVPKGTTSYEYLKKLTIQGLHERGLADDPRYVERAKRELRDIRSIPFFADFLLITREIIQFAVNHKTEDHPRGIRVGPGRGSTAGCLVAYAIGVHKVDSIRYKLLFERFLNPARPKMPDIDTDFSQMWRHEVFDHVVEEYGEENVLPVAAFQTLQVRGAMRRLATAMGMPFKDLKKFTQYMADAWGQEDDEDDDEEDHIRVENLPQELIDEYPELVEFIEGIIGTKSAISKHASGVIIFSPDDSIRSCVPSMWSVPSKRMTCQFDLKSAEAMGLMKQDLLGLRTLDTIDEAVALIEEQTGEELDPDSWIPDEEEGDRDVYKMIAAGNNNGVFQLEGGTMQGGIVKMLPHGFEDIVTCTAIYRKGPILAGAPTRYIANKKAKQIKVLHPSLEPILGDTWGEMAYQEQLMQITSDLAGFDQGGVADVLAAVRFKDPQMMGALKEKFVSGCAEVSSISETVASKIWAQLETQSSYLFNRCLTGDTLVYRSNYTHSSGQTISLAELYRIWHGGPVKKGREHSLRSAYRRRGLSIKAYKDGAIKRAKVRDIHYNGVKSVWKLTLANGMSITSTGNHRHLAIQGWRRTDELLFGDELVVDSGNYARPSLNNKHARSGLGKDWASRSDTGRAVAADGRNRPSRGGHVAALKAVTAQLPDLCERCGETEGRLERAHLDGDRTNNVRENVMMLCNHCHKQHDWDTGQRVRQYEHGYIAATSEIVGIEFAGYEETYDLEMDDPSHNFVANGIVTHNSHAAAYSLLTYQTARLKCWWPLQFLTALMRTVPPKTDPAKAKRQTYLAEALDMGFRILPPNINRSGAKFSCGEDRKGPWLRFGFVDVKGVGMPTAKKILAAREAAGGKFRNMDQITVGKSPLLTPGLVTKLDAAGCFHGLPGGNERDMRSLEEVLYWQFDDVMAPLRTKYANKVHLPGRGNSRVRLIGELVEAHNKKTGTGRPYMTWRIRWTPSQIFTITIWEDADVLWDIPKGSIVMIEGKYSQEYRNVSVGDPDQVRVLRYNKQKEAA